MKLNVSIDQLLDGFTPPTKQECIEDLVEMGMSEEDAVDSADHLLLMLHQQVERVKGMVDKFKPICAAMIQDSVKLPIEQRAAYLIDGIGTMFAAHMEHAVEDATADLSVMVVRLTDAATLFSLGLALLRKLEVERALSAEGRDPNSMEDSEFFQFPDGYESAIKGHHDALRKRFTSQ